jgi:pilus assembly protein Flp/PilA
MLELYVKFQTFIAGRKDEKGATAVEYALMVSLIAIAIIAAVTGLGSKIGKSFNKSAGSLSS